MDSNFVTTYEERLTEFEKRIEENPSKRDEIEYERDDYMFQCMPFIHKYCDDNSTVVSKTKFNTKTTKGIQKRDVYNEYLETVENIYTGQLPLKRHDTNNHECESCGSTNIMHSPDVIYVACTDCGYVKEIMICEQTYKDEHECTEKIISYSYKRSNHFQEWLNQLQATESTNIPQEVIESLRSEFKKLKIKNVNEITHSKVRTLLKKLRLNRYYEHVPYILNILNGIPPMRMSVELQERLKMMFNEIQTPFEKHCPENRKNFLSYAYVLYKFCELLSEDDYLKYFPLLKSREKLSIQDSIWKNICSELKWEYIPTL